LLQHQTNFIALQDMHLFVMKQKKLSIHVLAFIEIFLTKLLSPISIQVFPNYFELWLLRGGAISIKTKVSPKYQIKFAEVIMFHNYQITTKNAWRNYSIFQHSLFVGTSGI